MEHWPPFYRTDMGRQYYDKTVPDLVRQLERLNQLLERLVERRPDDDKER